MPNVRRRSHIARRFTFCLFSILFLTLTCLVHASTLNVPGQYPKIEQALLAAKDGDTVLVAPGTYVENISFAAKVALRSTSGPATTIIRAASGTTVNIGGGSEISGFTITGGRETFGAGMVVTGQGAIIKGNIFQDNVQLTGGYGAAIGGNNASALIDGNIFRRNSGDVQFTAGVITFINGSSPQITNNVFEDNATRAITLIGPVGFHPKIFNNTIVRNTEGI